jgi:hypothetical protein
MITWKGFGRKRPCPNLSNTWYLLRGTEKKISLQDSRCPVRYSNKVLSNSKLNQPACCNHGYHSCVLWHVVLRGNVTPEIQDEKVDNEDDDDAMET